MTVPYSDLMATMDLLIQYHMELEYYDESNPRLIFLKERTFEGFKFDSQPEIWEGFKATYAGEGLSKNDVLVNYVVDMKREVERIKPLSTKPEFKHSMPFNLYT